MRFPFSKSNSQVIAGAWDKFSLKLFWQILPSLITVILLAILLYGGWLQNLDYQFYNNFTVWRGDRPWDERIAIIAIDDDSIQELGRFPWNRDRYKQLIEKIRPAQASVIAFDILWTEATPEDVALSKALENSANSVLAMAWDRSGKPILPVEILSNATVAIGHILKREDGDGIVRQVDLQIQDIPALSLAILQTYDLTTQAIAAPPNLNRPLWLNWTNHTRSMTTFPFRDVINGKVPTAKFRNKIILVGVTAAGIDTLVTPFERNPPVSGVHLHAITLRNLLQSDYLKAIAPQNIWLMSLCTSLCMSLLISRRSLWLPILNALSIAVLWLVVAYFAFLANHWLAVSTPLLMTLCTGGAIAFQSYRQIQRSLQIVHQKLRRAITHDTLTNLANRELVEERLQYLLTYRIPSLFNQTSLPIDEFTLSNAIAIADQQPLFGILCLTLNRFKTINDTFGHKVANLLLVEVAQRLQVVVSQEANSHVGQNFENATISRLGGAEFVILLENLQNQQAAIALSQNIQISLGQPFIIQQHQIDISTNIGLKFYGSADNLSEYGEPVTPETLLRDADTAMSFARRLGNNSYLVFEIAMREHILSRLQMEQDLRKAVLMLENKADASEFLIHYQPILSLHNMQIVGLEALIRWQHPEKGFISPAQFIPLAEATNLIVPIGDWIMLQACTQLYTWQQTLAKAQNLTVSVNLSAKQLVHENVLVKCLQTLEKAHLEPRYLKIELTESSLMENPQFAMQMLQKMRQHGIKIYIDDFGTGYSSLAYLHEFPFDGLKIDRSFVNNICNNSIGADIIQAIVTLANSMNAHIVAEGIETLEQLHYLQSLLSKSGDGQGFFLFRPLSAEAITTILAE